MHPPYTTLGLGGVQEMLTSPYSQALKPLKSWNFIVVALGLTGPPITGRGELLRVDRSEEYFRMQL